MQTESSTSIGTPIKKSASGLKGTVSESARQASSYRADAPEQTGTGYDNIEVVDAVVEYDNRGTKSTAVRAQGNLAKSDLVNLLPGTVTRVDDASVYVTLQVGGSLVEISLPKSSVDNDLQQFPCAVSLRVAVENGRQVPVLENRQIGQKDRDPEMESIYEWLQSASDR